MFDRTKIANLYGVVGLQQPLNPVHAILDANNIASTSGEFVTDNPYVKVESIYDNQDYKDLTDEQFNTVLKNMQTQSISDVCGRVFSKPDFIDRQVLYKNAHNKVDIETIQSGFNCFKIKVSNKKNVAFKIKRVLLDFTGTGSIELLLFNTSSSTPIESKVIAISSTNHEEVLDWAVNNTDSTYKGDYYLGYLTSYTGMGTLQPFKRNYENANTMSIISELSIEKYLFAGHTTKTLPDLRSEQGISESIGLNPDITVYYDYTDLITQNVFLFARAIKLAMQIKCIEVAISSLRSNITERQTQMNITKLIQQIEGVNSSEGGTRIKGLRPELNKSIGWIQKEVEKLQDGYFGDRGYIDTLT